MTQRRRRSVLLLAVVGMQVACTDPIVPETTEPLALTVETRPPVAGERLPAIDVTGLAGAVRVRVARSDLPCAVADATVRRTSGALTVVAHVSGNPAALCAGGSVVEYSSVIDELPAGFYRVRVYEAVFDDLPHLLGTKTVLVLAPES
jgi:type IV pilus biogenesis protein CpaD/CtpE